MSELLEKWESAKRDTENALEWENLPHGRKYQNDKFDISIAHCKAPILCRAGQRYAGAQNYWETDKAFSKAILEWIVLNWDVISPEVMVILREKESQALKDCQSFVDEMQSKIATA